MTAAVIARPSLISRCPIRWCLAAYGCTKDDAGNLRLHEGRPSTAQALSHASVHVTPNRFTEQDGSAYGVPLATVTLDGCDEVEVDLTVGEARAFSAALADFASEGVPVGKQATFAGVYAAGDPSGATLTIQRLDDVTFEYGSGAPKYASFGAVQLRAYNPDNPDERCQVSLSGPDAAAFARYVAAVAAEVTA